MKIELTPWVISETSASLSKKRRRTRSSDAQSSSNDHLAMAASFLDAAPSGPSSTQWEPLISLTFAHRVTLLGAVSTDNSLTLQESSLMQYLTRSTASTSFLSEESSSLPRISCLYDGSRLYACLDENRRLVSWKVDQTPEEGIGVKLNSSALSLSIEKDNVFGSCRDGSLFMARLTSDNVWEIEYIESRIPAGAQHVATFCDPLQTSKKKKRQPPWTLFQLYTEASQILICRHTFESSNSSKGYSTRYIQSPLEPLASEVRWVGRSQDVVVISYQVGSSQLVCSNVSLAHSQVVSTVRLPVLTCASKPHFGLVGSLLVMVAALQSGNEVSLYDVHRGGLVARQSLDVECDQVLSLLTDGKERVALVVARTDVICVALSSISQSRYQQQLTLAQGLSASAHGVTAGGAWRYEGREYYSADSNASLMGRAIRLLDEARGEILRKSAKSKKDSFLSCVYIDATRLLASNSGNSNNNNTVDLDHANNPQEPSEKLNGHHGKKRKANTPPSPPKELINGLPQSTTSAAAIEPRMLPQSFVESAASITIDILLIPNLADGIRNEARVFLRRFVRTGKVSARKALTNLSSVLGALERAKGVNKIAYSPVDLIFDLYRYCSDLSEHHMVATLHYLLTVASTGDICSQFHRNKKQLGLSESVVALLDKWNHLDEVQNRSEDEENDLATVSCKLALAAATALIQTIVLYSECNESLLKSAARNLFSQRELALMCRILSDSMVSAPLSGSARLRLMQWLMVICEELGVSALSEDVAADVAYARQMIGAEVRRTESLLPLKELVNATAALVQKAVSAARNAASSGTKKDVPETLPSYQIERLVF